MCLDTALLPSLLQVGILTYCLPALAPVKTTPRSHWKALVVFSVVPIPIWMTPVGCVVRCVENRSPPCQFLRRAWSSLDGEESKSIHMWGSCFYIFRTDACTWSKAAQFQNWVSPLLWISSSIFPPWFFQTRHLKNVENKKGQLMQFWLLMVLFPKRAMNYPGWRSRVSTPANQPLPRA